MKKAIVFGASGFVGSCLLTELLEHPDYDRVIVVVRKDLGIKNPKLKTLIGDISSLPNLKGELLGHEIFLAIGTTKKQIPNEDRYYQIDHDYPLMAAKIAKENGVKSVFVVTAIGANATSRFFYIRTKGELERDIAALQFPHTHIFRPSMILGKRTEHRPMERAFMGLWAIVNPLLMGGLKKYKGIEAKQIGHAMVTAANAPSPELKIYEWSEMNGDLPSD